MRAWRKRKAQKFKYAAKADTLKFEYSPAQPPVSAPASNDNISIKIPGWSPSQIPVSQGFVLKETSQGKAATLSTTMSLRPGAAVPRGAVKKQQRQPGGLVKEKQDDC